jgi:RNA polymerase sigma factor (sigma-70 family)
VTPAPSPGPGARAARRAVAGHVAQLFDQHASMVLGLCRLLLRDHHEAEDAAQQTFVSAYRSMLRGSEPREPAPWLAAIARNECRARMRKRMRAPVALDGELESQLTDPSDLVEIADRRTELAEITVAMADLPIRQREAVALRDFLGLSYEEVATTLSVSVPVVESLLFRARRRLRDTVRTVPRYAAGIVVVPLALRAAVAREVPDFDSAGSAGIAGGAIAALAAGAAKLVSLPFAGKAVTAAALVAAGTAVAPLLDQPSLPPPPAALEAPAFVDGGAGPAAPALSLAPSDTPDPAPAAAETPSAAVAQADPEPGTVELPPAETSGQPAPPPPPPPADSADPDRIEASADPNATSTGESPAPGCPAPTDPVAPSETDPAPPPPDPAEACPAGDDPTAPEADPSTKPAPLAAADPSGEPQAGTEPEYPLADPPAGGGETPPADEGAQPDGQQHGDHEPDGGQSHT